MTILADDRVLSTRGMARVLVELRHPSPQLDRE
jgi:hypothetical protein